MIRCVVAVVVCSGSLALAGTSWGDARWAAEGEQPGRSIDSVAGREDVGDVVATLISAKAGRSVTRMSAGLAGDWAADIVQSPLYAARPIPNDPSLPHLSSSTANHNDETNDFDGRVDAVRAVAVPLPPAALTAIPGLIIAYIAARRIARE